jgi:molybdate transport system substrate-binding protein
MEVPMKTHRVTKALGALACFLLAQAAAVQAADLKVISTIGVKSFVEELAPQFERTTGHKLTIKFGTANVLKREIEAGEAFDVAIMTAMVADDLIRQGRLVASTRTDVARGGIGVAVRAGLTKPDISTVAALKRALLDAKSITYAKEGASGIYFAGVIEKWGLTDALKAKTVLGAGNVGEIAARGEADMAVQLITELISVKGLELVGPLPAEVQNWVVLTAGVSSNLKEPGPAVDFIKFLTAPAAVPILKSKGLEPGTAKP